MAKQQTAEDLSNQYYELAAEQAKQRAKVAHMDLDRHEWIDEYSEQLVGSMNDRTGKDHTWTSAVKWVRGCKEHMTLKRAQIDEQEGLDLLTADVNRLRIRLGIDINDALMVA